MISLIIVAALVALVQVSAARNGSPSPLTTSVSTGALAGEEIASALVSAVVSGGTTVSGLPGLVRENRRLQQRNRQLEQENARLHEQVAAYREEVAIAAPLNDYPRAVEARVVGYPPENGIETVTIDKGTRGGVHRDDGVLAAQGVVGRIVEAGPFVSKVALITDFTSTIPALVQRGRYWGVARGNESSVRLDYVSQDASLRVGDRVITGEARSFHSGALIGTIVSVERSPSTLYQTAVVKPAVDFSRLDRLVVVPKQ